MLILGKKDAIKKIEKLWPVQFDHSLSCRA
jgi:hypothetical protein